MVAYVFYERDSKNLSYYFGKSGYMQRMISQKGPDPNVFKVNLKE